MNRLLSVTVTLAALAAPALAQQLDLPRPSPFAKVSQTLGVTEVTVDYSCPAVNGRQIWGALVPWDKVWRTGANASTKITFSKDVTVAGKPVPAGTYALYTIPSQSKWTVILSKNTQLNGAFGYKQEEDLMRFDATPTAIPSRERLAFLFSNFDNYKGELDLEWEKVRIAIPIEVKTKEEVAAAIKDLQNGAFRPWAQAARWQLDQKDLDGAMALVNRSLSLKEDWQNLWVKADILAAKGNKKDAIATAEKALKLSPPPFAVEELNSSIAGWKKK